MSAKKFLCEPDVGHKKFQVNSKGRFYFFNILAHEVQSNGETKKQNRTKNPSQAKRAWVRHKIFLEVRKQIRTNTQAEMKESEQLVHIDELVYTIGCYLLMIEIVLIIILITAWLVTKIK